MADSTDGWMDGRMDGQLESHSHSPIMRFATAHDEPLQNDNLKLS